MTVEVAPKSLFGQHSYPAEQGLILGATKEIDITVALVSPVTVEVPIPFQLAPANWRRNKIKEHLTKAKVLLERLGV